MHIWAAAERAIEGKAKVRIRTTSGDVVVGTLTDISDSVEIFPEDGGKMYLASNYVESLTVMDNLDYIERLAKEKKLL